MNKCLLTYILFSLFFQNTFASEETKIKEVTKKVLFLGDSITEGHGVSKLQTYPYLIQKMLLKNDKIQIEILSGSVSGSTTASAKSRLKWFLKAHPHIIILALGSNDGLRGIDLEVSEKNLAETIEMAKNQNVKVILAGNLLPPNYGEEYRKKFKDMFLKLSKLYQVPLIPFLLKGVGGEKDLNQEDGIHPNEKGHQLIATTVYKYLRPHL